MKDTGGSAFPSDFKAGYVPSNSGDEFAGGRWSIPAQPGMTLRDYFAAKAINGICMGGTQGDPIPALATLAYSIADAMLKARTE